MLDPNHRVPWFCRPAVGAALWLGRVTVHGIEPMQTHWAVTLLLLSPLVLAPLVTERFVREARTELERWLWLWIRLVQIPVAAWTAWKITSPASGLTGAMAVPWLLVTLGIATAGLLRLRRGEWRMIPELTLSAGLLFLPIGAVWLCLWRLGVRPLGFEDVIVLLTAIHFHFAGFILPLLAGWSGRIVRGRWSAVVCVGVLVGVPAVAVGITGTQLGWPPVLEALAATWLAAAGVGTAVLQRTAVWQPPQPRTVRLLTGLSSLALVGTMLLAAVYGWRCVHHWVWLDIPWMRAWHGTASAIGVCLPGVVSHMLLSRPADSRG